MKDAFIGAAIKRVSGEQLHVGVAYAQSTNKSGMVHLGWHEVLIKNEPITDTYAIAVLQENGLSPSSQRIDAFAGFARRVWRRNQDKKIPYSYSLRSTLRRNGDFVEGPDGAPGFTCATFVLAVFETAGFDLLDRSTWPERSTDLAWQRSMIELLKRYADEDHIKGLEELAGVLRIRPSEVAAAMLLDNHPASFGEVDPKASEVREQIEEFS
jgi:hypothetical protein